MSSFSWIAFSEDERERTLDLISQFQERDTRDELGIGRIRDAFADLLFPGTSTIQTRARYFLFIPWMYQRLEERRVGSDRIADRAERMENNLIMALQESDDIDGVIGRQAGTGLQRYPSSIYWRGLWIWGIRQFEGSRVKYHAALDDYYALLDGEAGSDAGDTIPGSRENWDPALPDIPADFPKEATLSLREDDARYLKHQIREEIPESMLAGVLDIGELPERTDFPWEYAHLGELAPSTQSALTHARNFSEVLHGAALLYNLMLAQERDWAERIGTYTDALSGWAETITAREDQLEEWNRKRFWALVEEHSASTPPPMVRFVESWIKLALESPSTIATDEDARRLIHDREVRLKRGRARLENQSALDAWGGDAGSSQLDYRWGISQTHLQDIFDGLGAA